MMAVLLVERMVAPRAVWWAVATAEQRDYQLAERRVLHWVACWAAHLDETMVAVMVVPSVTRKAG